MDEEILCPLQLYFFASEHGLIGAGTLDSEYPLLHADVSTVLASGVFP